SARGDAVREQQRVPLLEGRDVAWPRPRRDPTNHIDCAGHAFFLAGIYFTLATSAWSAAWVTSPAQPSATSPCVSWNCFTVALVSGPYSPSTSSGGSVPMTLSAGRRPFPRP